MKRKYEHTECPGHADYIAANKKGEHVVMNANIKQMMCTHCGGAEFIDTPCPIDSFVDKTNAFLARHIDCKQNGPKR